MQSNKGAAFFLRIAGVLLLITAIVAGLLAVVNQFTEKKIEENEQKQISDSIGALYEGSIEKQTLDLSFGEAVVGAYRVYSDGRRGRRVLPCRNERLRRGDRHDGRL